MSRNRRMLIVLIAGVLVILAMIAWTWFRRASSSPTGESLSRWINDLSSRAALISHLSAPCPGAPFLLPSIGFVGFLYADPGAPYTIFNAHPGMDIFGDGEPGTVPVYAASDGFLTRRADWKSAVIVRIPNDPLHPAQQIWTYYAHMANESGDQSYIVADYPAGTFDKPIKQGTLIGYQGLYNGSDSRQITMHLHFSVVRSSADGSFLNETNFNNTLDPSPYFGFTANANAHPMLPVQCGH